MSPFPVVPLKDSAINQYVLIAGGGGYRNKKKNHQNPTRYIRTLRTGDAAISGDGHRFGKRLCVVEPLGEVFRRQFTSTVCLFLLSRLRGVFESAT